jgi:glycerol uptake facilitator-like aquaporin
VALKTGQSAGIWSPPNNPAQSGAVALRTTAWQFGSAKLLEAGEARTGCAHNPACRDGNRYVGSASQRPNQTWRQTTIPLVGTMAQRRAA